MVDVSIVEHFMMQQKSTASGPDGLPYWIWRDYAQYLAPIITKILNSSLSQQYVPLLWKLANITPIPKESPLTDCPQLRPISLTDIIMRILEKNVFKQEISRGGGGRRGTASTNSSWQTGLTRSTSTKELCGDTCPQLSTLLTLHVEEAKWTKQTCGGMVLNGCLTQNFARRHSKGVNGRKQCRSQNSETIIHNCSRRKERITGLNFLYRKL